MSERQEKIADIVAEKRTQADRIERVAAAKMASGKMTSDHFAREVVATLRTEADRLEAAAKRESGNTAAMREALLNVYNILKLKSFSKHLGEVELMREFNGNVCRAKNMIDAALSVPPKNCDVGTAEEQAQRFHNLGDSRSGFSRQRLSRKEATMEANNMAAMREALLKALTALKVCEWEEGTDMDGVKSIISEIESALTAPPRNCDVGTAEEQAERFRNFCKLESSASGGHCTGCRAKCYGRNKCEFVWAQMPYEANEGGEL